MHTVWTHSFGLLEVSLRSCNVAALEPHCSSLDHSQQVLWKTLQNVIEIGDCSLVLSHSSMSSCSRQEPAVGSGIRRETLCEALDRLLKVSLGLVQSTESAQRQSSVGLLMKPMRLCGDGVGEVGDGELVLGKPVSSISSIVERANMVRIDLEGFVEVLDGVAQSAHEDRGRAALVEPMHLIGRVVG